MWHPFPDWIRVRGSAHIMASNNFMLRASACISSPLPLPKGEVLGEGLLPKRENNYPLTQSSPRKAGRGGCGSRGRSAKQEEAAPVSLILVGPRRGCPPCVGP